MANKPDVTNPNPESSDPRALEKADVSLDGLMPFYLALQSFLGVL